MKMAGIAALATMIVVAGVLGLRAAARERRERTAAFRIPPMGAFFIPEAPYARRGDGQQVFRFAERDAEQATTTGH
jgi:hypothetical protein